jgi:tetratricopeptide (TPR) repeat protein
MKLGSIAQGCLWVVLAATAAAGDPDPREAECSKLHQALRMEHADDAKALRDAWRAARPKCAGTGYYEYLLAGDERRAGDVGAAISTLEDLVRRKLPYHERGFVTLNSIRAEQAALSTPPDRPRMLALRDDLVAFSRQHPDLAYAHQQIAKESISLEEFSVAADRARKAIEIDGSAAARGYLVFALHELNQCAKAVPEIRAAIDGDHSLVRDASFMLSAVDCYAETGDTATGEAALRVLLRANPAMKDDTRVLQFQKYFSDKKAAGSSSR